jgi:hypothetical protein
LLVYLNFSEPVPGFDPGLSLRATNARVADWVRSADNTTFWVRALALPGTPPSAPDAPPAPSHSTFQFWLPRSAYSDAAMNPGRTELLLRLALPDDTSAASALLNAVSGSLAVATPALMAGTSLGAGMSRECCAALAHFTRCLRLTALLCCSRDGPMCTRRRCGACAACQRRPRAGLPSAGVKQGMGAWQVSSDTICYDAACRS